MGFGALIATIVAMTLLVSAMYVFVAGGHFMSETLNCAVKEMQSLKGEQMRTKIEISDVNISSNTDMNVTINNTGEERIREFSKMDVIVSYYSQRGKEVRWLPYTQSTPPKNDTWAVVKIRPDEMNPGILDPAEALNIWIRLSSPLDTNKSGWLVVATPNGVKTSSYLG
ncbi:hypothetical protein [Candidatus Alkanophaga liquidiphilum]|nr:hypothetical protein [Candidatus Alkanophaga liquidiphilum]RLG39322.1 MAG: hypothetical protein DRN91_00095 [Candidatus Alkanophagales archaeon]